MEISIHEFSQVVFSQLIVSVFVASDSSDSGQALFHVFFFFPIICLSSSFFSLSISENFAHTMFLFVVVSPHHQIRGFPVIVFYHLLYKEPRFHRPLLGASLTS